MIVRRREKEPFSTTVQLANLINGGLKAISENQTKGGRSKGRSSSVSRINPATKTFQALRIYINNELDELRKGVCASERLLKPGGLFAAVSFHSLEDRILKRMIKFASQPALPSSPASGVDEDGGEILLIPPSFTPVTRKPITPSAQEIHSNSRSRSAKLRLALRTDSPAALLENFDRMLHEKEDEY